MLLYLNVMRSSWISQTLRCCFIQFLQLNMPPYTLDSSCAN